MPSFRFRLIDTTGKDLGPFATQRQRWLVGERISRWHGDELEIAAVVAAEEHEPFEAYLVVRVASPNDHRSD